MASSLVSVLRLFQYRIDRPERESRVEAGNLFRMKLTSGIFNYCWLAIALFSLPAKSQNAVDWNSLGTGMNNIVQALAVDGTNIYAAGRFTTAGGQSAICVAKWNGNSWSALGSGMNDWVMALAVSDTNLYAGGYFTTAGGVSANRVARWNGSNWSALGTGIGPTMGIYSVRALAVSGTNLYAGGSFTTAGFTTVNNIARWNGSTWSAMGGMNHTVEALAVSGTNLYAGGWFTMAGFTAANSIARWNGSSWSALGSGMSGATVNPVYALAVSGTNLYAGGLFPTAGSQQGVVSIARWNGTAWASLGYGVGAGPNYYPSVMSLTASGNDLYAGGDFTSAGGVAANRIARWDGSKWSALGSGMSGNVLALAISGNELYAGGNFTSAGEKTAAYVARANILFSVAPGRFTNMIHSPTAGFSCMFVDATIGQTYRIQTSPDLSATNWVDLTNFTYTGPVVITNAIVPFETNRFFRTIAP